MRIGIDIGNVIIAGGGKDTQFFTENFLETPEMPGAYEAIRALNLAGHELHIVSKCGPVVEEKSLKWLNEASFLNLIPLHRIHFVRKRPLKAPMAEALELDIFIDDMQDVIESMGGIVRYRILHTSWEQTLEKLEEIL